MTPGPPVVWGRADSSSVAKVMWCAAELGLSVNRIDWGGSFGGGDDPAYRRLNPTGQIPTYQQPDGFVLWESHAILRYLALTRDGHDLYPKDVRIRADIDRWMDWSMSAAWAVSGVRSVYRTPGVQPVTIAEALEQAAVILAPLEARLGASEHVTGTGLSLADIPLGVWIHRWHRVPAQRPPLPCIERWYRALMTRDGFVVHVVEQVSAGSQSIGSI